MVAGPMNARADGASPPPAPRFEPRDLFQLRSAREIEISPDGRTIVYVRATGDIMTDSFRPSLWRIDAASDIETQLAPAPASDPRWAPDGERLAYVAPDARGHDQIFVRGMGGKGVALRITDVAASPSGIAWSPDGRRIAFAMFVPEPPAVSVPQPVAEPPGADWAPPPRIITSAHYQADGSGLGQPGHEQLFVVSADGGAVRQVTAGPFDVRGRPAWSADGRSLIFSSNRVPGRAGTLSLDQQIFEVRIADGALDQLTHGQGAHENPAPSPDGRRIAYTAFDDDIDYAETHLFVMDADGSRPRRVDEGLDRDVADIHWTADGRGLYVSYGDQGLVTIARTDLADHWQVLTRRAETTSFSASQTGVVAFALASTASPPDVAITDGPGPARRMTALDATRLGPLALARVTPLAVRSSYDGEAIGAWTATPPGYRPGRRYPTLLWIHGGPYGDEGPSWMTDIQLYAAAGYVVLYANPRGSISYGFAFAHQLAHPVPGHDYDDLMSVVDAAIAAGVADPARLYVTGGSYGGMMTAWIVGTTHRFRAAAAEKPIVNFTSEPLATDQYAAAEQETGHLPWVDPLPVWKASPLSRVGNVETPTMLLVGEDDRRTPPTEAEQFYDALQLRGVPSALVLFPGASHESLGARPSQRIAEDEIVIDWFRRFGGP
jgi:dipeptidyl aminopeptidase/acylaminoacyl peptidase